MGSQPEIQINFILDTLRSSSSSNFKREVLKDEKDNQELKRFLIAVYNPRINYFMTKLPEYTRFLDNETTLEGMYKLLDMLSGRKVTGSAAQELVSDFLSHSSQYIIELFELCILRDLRSNIGLTLINDAFNNLIPEVPYMRCSSLNGQIIEDFDKEESFFVQLKCDGIFSYIIVEQGKVSLSTRAGTIWYSDKLQEELKDLPDCVLIGEALIIEDNKALSRKIGNGLINSFIKREATLESYKDKVDKAKTKASEQKLLIEASRKISEYGNTDKGLRFILWDSLSLKEFSAGYSERRYESRLFTTFKIIEGINCLYIVDSEEVSSVKEAQAVAVKVMAQGLEGVIIKKKNAKFENKTSKDMVKIKAVLDADLICTAIEEGKGKYEGKIGALVLETSCGRLQVKVGTGLKDKDRELPAEFYLNKVVEIQYNEFIQSKSKNKASLFLPVFVEVREDKTQTTPYQELSGEIK